MFSTAAGPATFSLSVRVFHALSGWKVTHKQLSLRSDGSQAIRLLAMHNCRYQRSGSLSVDFSQPLAPRVHYHGHLLRLESLQVEPQWRHDNEEVTDETFLNLIRCQSKDFVGERAAQTLAPVAGTSFEAWMTVADNLHSSRLPTTDARPRLIKRIPSDFTCMTASSCNLIVGCDALLRLLGLLASSHNDISFFCFIPMSQELLQKALQCEHNMPERLKKE